jgi:hypothetical protein
MKIKGVDVSSLNLRQKNAMKRHSVHHTGNHIQTMVNAMKQGASFDQSHNIAMKKIGK